MKRATGGTYLSRDTSPAPLFSLFVFEKPSGRIGRALYPRPLRNSRSRGDARRVAALTKHIRYLEQPRQRLGAEFSYVYGSTKKTRFELRIQSVTVSVNNADVEQVFDVTCILIAPFQRAVMSQRATRILQRTCTEYNRVIIIVIITNVNLVCLWPSSIFLLAMTTVSTRPAAAIITFFGAVRDAMMGGTISM